MQPVNTRRMGEQPIIRGATGDPEEPGTLTMSDEL
jgi:hypothetical protein